jgi:phosphoglycerol transferase MdoB-like AlkP superfamily enzyme
MLPVHSVTGVFASARLAESRRASTILLTLIHLSAFGLLLWSESQNDWVSIIAFAFTWGLLNFSWLALLKRPLTAGALSLAAFVLIVLLSRFKFESLALTANFIDVMFIDDDTIAFLLAIFPRLTVILAFGSLIALPAMVYAWQVDAFRLRRRIAAPAAAFCLSGLAGIAFAYPVSHDQEFTDHNYVSKFARFGSVAVIDYFRYGILESDTDVVERLKPVADKCILPRKAPHIILVLDESSFDISQVENIKLPVGYRNHFRSMDGKMRSLQVESISGPTWYTEYNVLTGLSVRSYGRFADAVTRIAAGRVERGLPHALRRCGYRTMSQYPWFGNFLGARNFQISTGIQKFYDAKDLGTHDLQPDHFYYDGALRILQQERDGGPKFLLLYTMANHSPWNYVFRPELTPDWKAPGNPPEIDEYLRRQSMSERDYKQFVAKLRKEFPGEPFLIVRFGDHQPYFAKHIIDTALTEKGIAQVINDVDPRYFRTYYTVDAINFTPPSLASATGNLDAPYLPLIVLEAAGIPLDPSFTEQKKMFLRCDGRFYHCKEGAEVRRFNRLLIEAGLIRGM